MRQGGQALTFYGESVETLQHRLDGLQGGRGIANDVKERLDDVAMQSLQSRAVNAIEECGECLHGLDRSDHVVGAIGRQGNQRGDLDRLRHPGDICDGAWSSSNEDWEMLTEERHRNQPTPQVQLTPRTPAGAEPSRAGESASLIGNQVYSYKPVLRAIILQ